MQDASLTGSHHSISHRRMHFYQFQYLACALSLIKGQLFGLYPKGRVHSRAKSAFSKRISSEIG
jgi:hypothetical protein